MAQIHYGEQFRNCWTSWYRNGSQEPPCQPRASPRRTGKGKAPKYVSNGGEACWKKDWPEEAFFSLRAWPSQVSLPLPPQALLFRAWSFRNCSLLQEAGRPFACGDCYCTCTGPRCNQSPVHSGSQPILCALVDPFLKNKAFVNQIFKYLGGSLY